MKRISKVPGSLSEKHVSIDNGLNWLYLADDPSITMPGTESDSDIAAIQSALTAAGQTGSLHAEATSSLPTTLVGEQVWEAVVVKNTGNVDLTGVKVTDNPSSVTFTVGATLSVGGPSALSSIFMIPASNTSTTG